MNHRFKRRISPIVICSPTGLFGAVLAAGTAGLLGMAMPATATAEATGGARGVIEEVVVTARRREERLIDTPVAVTVMAQEEVERYYTRDLSSLTARIPGVSINQAAGGGAGGSMFIRGVGNIAVDYGADQPVAFVMDGMSFQRGHILNTGFFDVESVQVLKGPQTLFFGKNSPAGVIAVNSVSPEVGGEIDGFVRTAYEFETKDPVVETGVSFPVGDTLAFRIAGRYQDMRGGYLTNTAQPIDPNPTEVTGDPSRGASYNKFPEQRQNVVRFTTAWQPVENFSADLKIFRSYTRQNDAGRTVLFGGADGPGANPYYLGFPDPTQVCPDNKPKLRRNGGLPPASVANAHPFIDEDSRFHTKLANEVQTLELVWGLGDYTLTSLTGHWDYRHREYTNYDYTSYGIVISKQGESGESLTQELRLESNFEGPFNFMLGAFYEDMQRDLVAPVQILPNIFFAAIPDFIPNTDPDSPYFGSSLNYHQEWKNNIESWSAFASVDYDFSEQWSVTAGARYTEEKRDSFGGNLYERGLGFSPGGIFYSPKGKSDNVSPEVTVSWRPMDDLLVYGAFKTGFQSFGISNPGTVPNLSEASQSVIDDYFIFDETEVEGFELGVKGYFLDRRVIGDVTVFWYEYTDLQVAVFDSVTTTFSTQNAAVAHNTGIEAQATWMATDELQFRIAGQYTKLEFDKFPNAACFDGQAIDAGPPGCYLDDDIGARVQDLSGRRYGGPPVQINFGASYDTMISGAWGLELTADVIYHDEGFETRGQPNTAIDSRTVTNLATRLYQPQGNWEFAVVCSNCTNEIYVTSIQNKPLGKVIQGTGVADLTGQIAIPRLLSVQATYHLNGKR
jgi:iron complex outermembrane recepter protein